MAAAADLPAAGFSGEDEFLSTLQSVAGSTDAQFLNTIQQTVSSLEGRQGAGVAAIPLMDAWDDELSMVYELSEAESSGATTSEPTGGSTYSLPSGETVQIYTWQQGLPGAAVYYITAGWLSAETYTLSSWPESLAIAEDFSSAINNPTGLTPTIKLVTWASSSFTGLLEDVALYGPLLGTIINYDDAAGNVPAVGQAIAQDVYSNGYDPSTVTLIGHSLGGQASITAGFDYEQLTGQQIETIEALDPARRDSRSRASTRMPAPPLPLTPSILHVY